MGVPGWARLTKQEKAALKERRVAALENHLFGLAMNAANEMTQVNAAVKLHAMYKGAPVSRKIAATADEIGALSDDALRAEFAGDSKGA